MDKTHCRTHPKTQERRETQLPKASNQEVSALWDCAFFTCRKALLREFYSPVVSRGLKAASNRQQRGVFPGMGIGIVLEETVLYHLLPPLVQRRGKGQEWHAPLLAA